MTSFGDQLAAFAKKAKGRHNAVVKKIVLDVGSALIFKSPVGNPDKWQVPAPPGYVGGRFRANWQYALDAPDISTSTNIDPSGAKTLAAINAKIPDEAAGRVHYITNSLPYAKRLEECYSKQAPSGMVRLTVNEFKPIVAAAIRSLK